MKKLIKAEDGKVTQIIEFDSGSKIELPLDKDGNLKWFDDTKLIKKNQLKSQRGRITNRLVFLPLFIFTERRYR